MCQKVHHLLSVSRGLWAMRGIDFDTDDRGSVRNTRGDLNRLHRYYCGDKEPKEPEKDDQREHRPENDRTARSRTSAENLLGL